MLYFIFDVLVVIPLERFSSSFSAARKLTITRKEKEKNETSLFYVTKDINKEGKFILCHENLTKIIFMSSKYLTKTFILRYRRNWHYIRLPLHTHTHTHTHTHGTTARHDGTILTHVTHHNGAPTFPATRNAHSSPRPFLLGRIYHRYRRQIAGM